MTHGFPILEWNYTGFRRALVDYQLDYAADPAMFTLPDVATITPPGILQSIVMISSLLSMTAVVAQYGLFGMIMMVCIVMMIRRP